MSNFDRTSGTSVMQIENTNITKHLFSLRHKILLVKYVFSL